MIENRLSVCVVRKKAVSLRKQGRGAVRYYEY